MKIDDMIEQLTKIKKQYGNMPIYLVGPFSYQTIMSVDPNIIELREEENLRTYSFKAVLIEGRGMFWSNNLCLKEE